jgi:hypothetical protein
VPGASLQRIGQFAGDADLVTQRLGQARNGGRTTGQEQGIDAGIVTGRGIELQARLIC